MAKRKGTIKRKSIFRTILLFIYVAIIVTFVTFLAMNYNAEETGENDSTAQGIGNLLDSEFKYVPEVTEVSLIALGDNLMHEPVIDGGLQPDGTYNYDSYFDNIRSDIEQADIAIVNQETILGGASLGYSGYPLFNSPQEMGDSLVRVGFDVVLQATNHSIDKGYKGVQNAMDFWKQNHPDTVTLGLNESAEAQEEITVVEKNGIKIAMLNYTYGLNGLILPSDKPYLVNLLDEEVVARHIQKAKTMADVVMVFPHWGTEYVYDADSYQEQWTEFFAEQGVDIVIGTHPHVIQPVEWVERQDGGKMLVYYSLGNMVSCQDRAPRMLGGMARITIQKTGSRIEITNSGLTPIVTHYESRYDWNYGIYKLSDYTQELASNHGVRRKDSKFTLDYLNSLSQEVVGEMIQP